MAAPPRLRIGTRGSPLALAQAAELRRRLADAHPDIISEDDAGLGGATAIETPGGATAIETVVIRTSGDRILDRNLAEIGGKGLFTKEIDAALIAKDIDIAVHSMKDLPAERPAGLIIGAVLEREDPRDVLIGGAARIADLPRNAVVGTSSSRRRAQLLEGRPDLRVVALRGNVATRIAKIAAGEADATLLARAGLRRLGRAEADSAVLSPDEMLPAICQGIIAVECREADTATRARLAAIGHGETAQRAACERAVLIALGGDCLTPVAALAEIDGSGAITLTALLAHPDGAPVFRERRHGPAGDAAAMGQDAGAALATAAGPDFLAGLK